MIKIIAASCLADQSVVGNFLSTASLLIKQIYSIITIYLFNQINPN